MQGVLFDENRGDVANVTVLVGKPRVVSAVRVVALARVLVVVEADALMHHMPVGLQRLVHRRTHDVIHPRAAGWRPAIAVVAIGAVVGIHGAIGGMGVGEEAQVVGVEYPGDVANLGAVELGEVTIEVVVQAVDPPTGFLRTVLVDPPVGAAAQVAIDVDGGNEENVDLLQHAGQRLVAGGHVAQQHEHGVFAVGLAGMNLGLDEDCRLARLVQACRRLVDFQRGNGHDHRVAFGAFLRQIVKHDTAPGRRSQLAQVIARLLVIAGLVEAAGFGLGDQRVVCLGDVAGAGQGLGEHRRQDALLGRRRVAAIIDVGRRAGQCGQGRQASAHQHRDTQGLQKRVFHDDSLS
ncbi:hypothetical protein D3C78_983670 [compost metagenome]